jgi:CRISPR-associated protein Csb1
VSPNALLFGAWNSTGQGGGLGAKFGRCLVSEIVAVNVPAEEVVVDRRTEAIEARTAGQRTGSRIDPLGILSNVSIYRSAEHDDWTPFEEKAARDRDKPILFARKKGDRHGRPSLINHGNVTPSVQPLGVTCDYLDHTFVLSFAALRRLRFGGQGERDASGRSLLAALGLLALAEQDARGYALRSRCDLVCDGKAPLELVHADGTTQVVAIDRASARSLYTQAFDAAKAAGFDLRAEPLRLEPQPKLVEIVRRSQDLALSGAGEGADEDGPGA